MEQQCPRCGADLPPEERPPQCPVCGTDLQAEAGEGIPFDDPVPYGFPAALWQTWRGASLTPNAFYPRIPTSMSVGWPLLYALLFWWFYAAANVLIQQPVLRAMMAASPSQARIPAGFFETTPEMIAFQFAAGPFLFAALILLASAAFHGLLYLVNGARPEFAVTLRTVCYTAGAYVAYLLPGLGPLLHPIWAVALLVVGLARAHQTDTWRGAFAVILPTAACCGVLVVFMMLAYAAVLGALNLG